MNSMTLILLYSITYIVLLSAPSPIPGHSCWLWWRDIPWPFKDFSTLISLFSRYSPIISSLVLHLCCKEYQCCECYPLHSILKPEIIIFKLKYRKTDKYSKTNLPLVNAKKTVNAEHLGDVRDLPLSRKIYRTLKRYFQDFDIRVWFSAILIPRLTTCCILPELIICIDGLHFLGNFNF